VIPVQAIGVVGRDLNEVAIRLPGLNI
jgi:hypothetical protein